MENVALPMPFRAEQRNTVVVPIHRAIWQTNFQPERFNIQVFNSASTPVFFTYRQPASHLQWHGRGRRRLFSFFVPAGLN
jgi:hypothetical protein